MEIAEQMETTSHSPTMKRHHCKNPCPGSRRGFTLGGEPNLKSSHNLNRIADPAASMAFATATDFRVTYHSRFNRDFDHPNDSKTADGGLAYRHGDKVPLVYFDGHVGEMSQGDLKEIDKSRGGRNSDFWKPGN